MVEVKLLLRVLVLQLVSGRNVFEKVELTAGELTFENLYPELRLSLLLLNLLL